MNKKDKSKVAKSNTRKGACRCQYSQINEEKMAHLEQNLRSNGKWEGERETQMGSACEEDKVNMVYFGMLKGLSVQIKRSQNTSWCELGGNPR